MTQIVVSLVKKRMSWGGLSPISMEWRDVDLEPVTRAMTLTKGTSERHGCWTASGLNNVTGAQSTQICRRPRVNYFLTHK